MSAAGGGSLKRSLCDPAKNIPSFLKNTPRILDKLSATCYIMGVKAKAYEKGVTSYDI